MGDSCGSSPSFQSRIALSDVAQITQKTYSTKTTPSLWSAHAGGATTTALIPALRSPQQALRALALPLRASIRITEMTLRDSLWTNLLLRSRRIKCQDGGGQFSGWRKPAGGSDLDKAEECAAPTRTGASRRASAQWSNSAGSINRSERSETMPERSAVPIVTSPPTAINQGSQTAGTPTNSRIVETT